jgi:predicted AAA+ superfamily ATPase
MERGRTIKKEMEIFLGKYPILVLTGPRQSGKTTFLKNEFVSNFLNELIYLAFEQKAKYRAT